MPKPPPGDGATPLTPNLLITSPSVGTTFNGGSHPDTIVVSGTAFLTCDDPGGQCDVGDIYRVVVQLGDSTPQQATLNLDAVPAQGTEQSGSWSFMGTPQPGALNELSIKATLTAVLGMRPHQQVATVGASVTVLIQLPLAPPPDGSLLAACAKLYSTAPLGPSPSEPFLHVGEYDASKNAFTWAEGPPFYQRIEVIPPDPNDPGSPLEPIRITRHYARVVALVPRVSVNLINNASTHVAFTANERTAVAPAGSATASVEGPFANNVLFSFGVGVNQLGFFELRLVPTLLQAGCIVIPAIPVAVIYQPPTGVGTLKTSDTTGVALTHFSSDIFSDATPGTVSDASVALNALGDFLSTVGDFTGQNVISTVANTLHMIANNLEGHPKSWDFRVQTDNRMEVTATIGQSWSSVPQLGPGDGDVILYLQDVTFLVYKDNDHTLITPLRFTGTGAQDVTVARLRPGAANPPALSAATRASLLAFDPVATGNPGAIMPGNRYSFVERFSEDNAGLVRTLELAYTEQFTMEEIHSLPLADGTPSSAGMASRYARQGYTTAASVEATGPFDFEVYYDRLFGTFAYLNKLSGPQPALQTDVAPGATSSGNISVAVAKSLDGRIFYNWWQLGQGGHGWKELEGNGRTDAAPAAALVGNYLFVLIKGLDGNLYLNQGELGNPFVGWQVMS